MSRQEQRQVQSQQTVEQQEMKYMIQQDFLNIIGIAQDVQETINFYQDDPNHQMVQVQMNRLILQLNLSNGIHVDLSQRINDRNSLSTQKSYIGTKLENVMENNQFDDRIKGYLNKYKKQNLCENPYLKQENGIEVKVKSNFDQSVVQKVIGGMRKVDDDMNEINNGKKIQMLTDDEIKKYLEKRSQNAKSLLKQNQKENSKDLSSKKKSNDQSPKPMKEREGKTKQAQLPQEEGEQPKKQQARECKCMIQ